MFYASFQKNPLFIKKILLLLSLSGTTLHGALVSTDEVLFQEKFDSPEALKRWQTTGRAPEFLPGGGPGGSNAVRFVQEKKDGTTMITIPLDPAKISGPISFEGYIRGSGLSGKASYFGPKFMLTVDDGRRKDFPEPEKGFGSYGWKKVKHFYNLPAGCRQLEFSTGIQTGRGVLEVAGIEIRRRRVVVMAEFDRDIQQRHAATACGGSCSRPAARRVCIGPPMRRCSRGSSPTRCPVRGNRRRRCGRIRL